MARSQQGAIEMFMSITGASEASALQKLDEHGGDLNEAVNAYFNEGEAAITQPAHVPVPQNDMMDVDDPIEVEPREHPRRLFPTGTNLNPFSLLDPSFVQSFFDGRGAAVSNQVPLVSHPRDVREIPIEFKDGDGQSSHAGPRPIIEDITGSAYGHGPEIHGNVIIDDDDDDDDLPSTAHATQVAGQREREGGVFVEDFHGRHPGPSAPRLNARTDYGNEIEEEMLQAAIEASKREAAEASKRKPFVVLDDSSDTEPDQGPFPSEDVELARAVSLSLKTAEQEKALRDHGLVGTMEQGHVSGNEQLGKFTPNGRQGFDSSKKGTSSRIKLEAGDPSIQEGEDTEEHPRVRQRSRHFASGVAEPIQEVGQLLDNPLSSPGPHSITDHAQHNGDAFREWGGISSEEHDEAVMLEAALFGRIPEGTAYTFGSQTGGLYPRSIAHPPSPTLTTQRLLREQQDDEYLASLQADREKELKAIQEAEIRRLEEVAAREAALEQEKLREEEVRRKLLEEEEFEQQLVVKEASLPQEPAPDNESAVTLLVRMPDGSRRGRRFLKSDRLQLLFDFIDIGRGVKPGTYRLKITCSLTTPHTIHEDLHVGSLKEEPAILNFPMLAGTVAEQRTPVPDSTQIQYL